MKIPELAETTAASAKATLESLGLKVTEERAYDSSVPADRVIGTNPAAGAEAKAGDTITLIISRGPDPATQPTPNASP
ncbi:MAG: PASTA domain-containing protein [Bifidobacteriaceae bacterium]|nr:PASTA domain-containing protein [Bifidobacteriaceae bacterium]